MSTLKNIAARAETVSFEKHGYSEDDFAVAGEVTAFNGCRIVCGHDSCDHRADFKTPQGPWQSDWQLEGGAGARLTDGTVLYEGFCPEHRIATTEARQENIL